MTSSPGRPQLNSPVTFVHARRRTHSIDSDLDSDASATPTNAKSSPSVAHATPTYTSPHLRPPNEHASSRHQLNQSPVDQRPDTWQPGHRPRQHSQGFFEPLLPSTTSSNNQAIMNNLTTSQLAAQAAMHAQSSQHSRKRSQTLPDQAGNAPTPPPSTRYPVPERTYNMGSNSGLRNIDGFIGGHSLAAATAAQVATYPRSPQYSPGIVDRGPPVPDKDARPVKEKSKMKLFSKPKSIGIHKDKDFDKKHPALPSPGKMSLYSVSSMKLTNASTTSLVDPSMSSGASLYSSNNGSTSTLVPTERMEQKEKEKHKHHFLSRQKNKLWDKEDYHLPLSSASSISKPTDPNAPQPLYSFSSSSPANPSAFSKSVSGLDLRHGGRALREKKKEEKAASNLSTTTFVDGPGRDRDTSFSNPDWPHTGSFGSQAVLTPGGSVQNLSTDYGFTAVEVATLGATFGVPGITPDDAWPLLKARLLMLFEGEDPRPPIEDFNSLVSVHLRRCIQRRAPATIIEEFNDLLQTGFSSLDQTLKQVPDERLVPHLVAMWSLVFHTILPFLQAVFLPLDLEFKGRGPIMSTREAADFWGVALPDSDLGSEVNPHNIPLLGEDLDVRRMVLQTFRDAIFLPRFDALMAIFSRLSLDSINATVPADLLPPPPIGSAGQGTRPGTASSTDAALSSLTSPGSFPSSSSTLLDSMSTTGSGTSPFSLLSSANRSRATSNTSAGSFPGGGPGFGGAMHSQATPFPTLAGLHAQAILDTGARVTEMVGRVLQCTSVLSSVQSGDDAQRSMEELTKTLKWNWLGRGRTGRQRRGFVGTKLRSGTGNSSTAGGAISGLAAQEVGG
jgi:HbrB-like